MKFLITRVHSPALLDVYSLNIINYKELVIVQQTCVEHVQWKSTFFKIQVFCFMRFYNCFSQRMLFQFTYSTTRLLQFCFVKFRNTMACRHRRIIDLSLRYQIKMLPLTTFIFLWLSTLFYQGIIHEVKMLSFVFWILKAGK